MKKTLFLALSSAMLLQLVSCSPALTPVYTVEPTEMTLKIVDGTLTTSSVTISIELAEDDRYYFCNVVTDSAFRSYKSSDAFMSHVMDTVSRAYEQWKAERAEYKEYLYKGYNVWGEAPFSSVSLGYGKHKVSFSPLEPDTRYVAFGFCVDPDTRKPIGELFSIEFATKPLTSSDLGFVVTFTERSDGAFITVNPSNDNDSYIWDFAEVGYIDEYYKGHVTEFLIDEIDLYRSSGWLEELVTKGIDGRNVSGWMYQPDTFLFMVAGYDGGFTTQIFTDTIVYPFEIDTLSFRQ